VAKEIQIGLKQISSATTVNAESLGSPCF